MKFVLSREDKKRDDMKDMLINTICNLQSSIFWPCDEKKETETSWLENWVDFKGIRQQGKEVRSRCSMD